MQPEIIVAHERFRLDLNHSFQNRPSGLITSANLGKSNLNKKDDKYEGLS